MQGATPTGGSARRSRRFWRLTPENAWRRNLYIVMFGVFVSFTGFTFVMPFLPLYIQQLGVTNPGDAALWSGLIFGVSPLLSGLLAPFWSILAERQGRKIMLQRALGAFVFLIALMAFVTNIYQLLILRLGIGLFGGVAAMSIALASTIAPRHQVGEAVGLIQATQLASGIAAPFIGGIIVDSFGLHGSFFLASGLCAIAFLIITFGYREDQERGNSAVETTKAQEPQTPLRELLHLPIFIGLAIAIFGVQFIDKSFGPLLPLYIGELDAPAERIGTITGIVMTLGAITASFAAVWAGRLSTRRDPRPLLFGSLVAGALLCGPIAFVGHWWQLMILRSLLGLFAGGALTLTYAIGGRDMPAGARLGAFGTLAGLGQVGGATAPFVTGALSKWSSLNTIFLVDAALYTLLVLWTWSVFGRRSTSRVAQPDPALVGDD